MKRSVSVLLTLSLVAGPVTLVGQPPPRTPIEAVATIEAALAEPPVLLAPTPPAPPATPVITDTAGLLAAVTRPGTYQLAPGTYRVNLRLATDGVEVRGADLPDARVSPGATRAYQIVPADRSRPTLSITGSNVTISGVTIGQGQTDRAVVVVGSSTATDPLAQPDAVTLDRVEIAAAAAGGRRGIEAHTRGFTLSRSRVTGFWFQGQDSQAFLAINGPGPYTLVDNELQGSGENVMFGGGSIRSAALIPSNIVIRNNLLLKPQTWRQHGGSVKNSLEFKAAKGALVEGNILDGCWRDAQAGHMIVLTPRNQNNDSPWIEVTDITLRGNRTIRHTDGYAVNILGRDNLAPSQQTARITIEGNLFEDSPKGILVGAGVEGWLRLARNTLPGIRWNLLTFSGAPNVLTPLTVERNVARSGDYGVNGDGTPVGVATLAAYTTGLVWTGNVIERTAARNIPWPAGTTLLAPGALAPLLDPDGHYTPGGAGW